MTAAVQDFTIESPGVEPRDERPAATPSHHGSCAVSRRAADFNAGVDDARDYRMMRHGMSRAYYDGYAFFTAVDGLV